MIPMESRVAAFKSQIGPTFQETLHTLHEAHAAGSKDFIGEL